MRTRLDPIVQEVEQSLRERLENPMSHDVEQSLRERLERLNSLQY